MAGVQKTLGTIYPNDKRPNSTSTAALYDLLLILLKRRQDDFQDELLWKHLVIENNTTNVRKAIETWLHTDRAPGPQTRHTIHSAFQAYLAELKQQSPQASNALLPDFNRLSKAMEKFAKVERDQDAEAGPSHKTRRQRAARRLRKMQAGDPGYDVEVAAKYGVPVDAELKGLVVYERYRISDRIAAGAHGVTYVAHDSNQDDRQVVLKLYKTHVIEDSQTLDHIKHSLRAIADLEHPRLVRVISQNLLTCPYTLLHFSVHEYVASSTTLHTWVGKHGCLRAGAAALIMEHLLDAAAYLHGTGIIHRDIHPGNILVEADELGHIQSAKLADFDMVRLPDVRHHTTHGRGNAYSAPEIFAGDSTSIGPAADIYSIAASIIYGLTGIEQDRERGDTVKNGSREPEMFWHVLRKAYEIKTTDRFQSANDVLHSLQKWIDGQNNLATASKNDLAEFVERYLLWTTKMSNGQLHGDQTEWNPVMWLGSATGQHIRRLEIWDSQHDQLISQARQISVLINELWIPLGHGRAPQARLSDMIQARRLTTVEQRAATRFWLTRRIASGLRGLSEDITGASEHLGPYLDEFLPVELRWWALQCLNREKVSPNGVSNLTEVLDATLECHKIFGAEEGMVRELMLATVEYLQAAAIGENALDYVEAAKVITEWLVTADPEHRRMLEPVEVEHRRFLRRVKEAADSTIRNIEPLLEGCQCLCSPFFVFPKCVFHDNNTSDKKGFKLSIAQNALWLMTLADGALAISSFAPKRENGAADVLLRWSPKIHMWAERFGIALKLPITRRPEMLETLRDSFFQCLNEEYGTGSSPSKLSQWLSQTSVLFFDLDILNGILDNLRDLDVDLEDHSCALMQHICGHIMYRNTDPRWLIVAELARAIGAINIAVRVWTLSMETRGGDEYLRNFCAVRLKDAGVTSQGTIAHTIFAAITAENQSYHNIDARVAMVTHK